MASIFGKYVAYATGAGIFAGSAITGYYVSKVATSNILTKQTKQNTYLINQQYIKDSISPGYNQQKIWESQFSHLDNPHDNKK